MILTGGNRNAGRTTSPSVTLSTTNVIWTVLGSNSGLSRERPATGRLKHGKALQTTVKIIYIYMKIQSVPCSKHSPSRL